VLLLLQPSQLIATRNSPTILELVQTGRPFNNTLSVPTPVLLRHPIFAPVWTLARCRVQFVSTTASGQVGLRLQAFAIHGNTSSITNRVFASARPSAPTSPVELWRSIGANWLWNLLHTKSIVTMSPAGKDYIPPARPDSPGPLAADFFQQQLAKQRNNNYHSTSLRNMVATSVNRTALHPGGVQYVRLLPSLPLTTSSSLTILPL
jgi:hypothetical protein